MKTFKMGNKRRISMFGFVVLLTIIIMSSLYISKSSYAVKVNNRVIGFVKNKDDISKVLDDIKFSYKEKYNREVIIPENIIYEKKFTSKDNRMDTNDLKSKIEDSTSIQVEAYALNVNGQDLVIMDSENEANKILKDIKEQYLDRVKDSKIKEVSFYEKVDVVSKFVEFNEIIDYEEAYKLISIGEDEIKKYEIKAGDTASHISVKYDISLNDIEKANPGVDLEKLQIGQILNLTLPKPLISTKIIEEVEYEEKIPYEVEYEETDSLYKGDKKVKVKGKEGKKIVKAEIIRKNGIEEDKIIINEKILDEPKTHVVLKGVKERPKTMAYGSFNKPTRGYLTSRYGPRWGRNHNGIDIGARTGTPVKASDGGKVIYSGWNGGYGNLVIIDHENGYKTYYAHNSALKVKKGQRVYRGQVISLSGATGNVTGPHVHFEVRKNGVVVNPLKFINY